MSKEPYGVDFKRFRKDSRKAIANPHLQAALEGATVRFTQARLNALADLPASDALRDHFKQVRAATLANLAEHLATFEQNATAAGAHVHYAINGESACRLVLDIATKHNVQRIIKSKSMVTEEIRLNAFLEQNGQTPVETDLGEYLIQLAGEMPSHIIAPAIHITRQQAAERLSKQAGRELPADDIPALTAEARRLLRNEFLQADMGISGGNIAVAETGSIVLVTNEGNGRMVTSMPRVHVAIIGIEKVVPTWQHAASWLALLARSATGQPMSIYTSITTGPAQPNDPDGPEAVHIIFLDNNRSNLLNTEYEEALQCIRCGACLNACPVYREAGGHAYHSPYSGPIGAIITPLLFEPIADQALPYASTLCGACKDACPVRIDLPRMLLAMRRDDVANGFTAPLEKALEGSAAFIMRHPNLFNSAGQAGRLLQLPLVNAGHLQIPAGLNPGQNRKLPALAPKSFRARWAAGEFEEQP